MGHAQKVSLAFREDGPPYIRRVITWDVELLYQQPDNCFDRNPPGWKVHLLKECPTQSFCFGQAATDLEMGRRNGAWWIPQVVISEDPLIAVVIHLVLIACLFNFQKIGLRSLVKVKLSGNAEIALAIETQWFSGGPAADDCLRGITFQPYKLQCFP